MNNQTLIAIETILPAPIVLLTEPKEQWTTFGKPKIKKSQVQIALTSGADQPWLCSVNEKIIGRLHQLKV